MNKCLLNLDWKPMADKANIPLKFNLKPLVYGGYLEEHGHGIAYRSRSDPEAGISPTAHLNMTDSL